MKEREGPQRIVTLSCAGCKHLLNSGGWWCRHGHSLRALNSYRSAENAGNKVVVVAHHNCEFQDAAGGKAP